ncbi:hypothetical protein [Rhizobium sp. GN54]|uniref:hypothetical protein n=1 Tax=Rhizobium sp. GN54 TaxID=2898150 RepID=UPI001E323CA8|nr:hypothetical protein [Rhizobium sp. GN54]MCD2183316.1 hypothetical protein [Rhizobium sp. GN54]
MTIEPEFILPGDRARMGAGASVINVPERKVDNRLSEMQVNILSVMRAFPAPTGCKIGHLPTTGDIVDALGLPRNKATFASVSRSLARLDRAGKLASWQAEISIRGRGNRWSLPPQGAAA